MKKILLATVAILAFAAPSFAQDKTDKTIGQAPPSGASSFYLAQDTATMKCEVVNVQPAAGGNMKVIGAAHPTQASAETALKADKTCKYEVTARIQGRGRSVKTPDPPRKVRFGARIPDSMRRAKG